MATTLLERNTWSSIDHLNALYWSLSSVLFYQRPGAVLEVGCHAGHSSVWLQRIIQDHAPDRELHLFDSFEGLPAPSDTDTILGKGELAISQAYVEKNFVEWDLPAPAIHAGWFEDTLPAHCPDEVCFAYLDGDYHDSILTSLTHIYPRLVPGGMLLIDDYCDRDRNPRAWDGFPGVKAACDTYFAELPVEVVPLLGAKDMAVGVVRKPLDPA
jgi:O-methyltransferase